MASSGVTVLHPTMTMPVVPFVRASDGEAGMQTRSHLCRYWNPSEFSSGPPTLCLPPHSRCIGGKYHECSAEFDGEYCARCRDGFYIRDGACMLCVPGETQKLYFVISSFVVLINVMFFVAPADLTRSVLLVMCVLKLFR
jgi:hypothetical protein